ncbi:hypothetical protein NDU88_007884 [Pleurodeles waltl]|uniref:CCHC-type domain-containing protein n=1 Tax=Pleurodeles waltl TaxID=8319 RepID=A0AAV7RVC1_PLEWA|nr:hypothetical protein NDU88_007884 [Pleurodeles waltl]
MVKTGIPPFPGEEVGTWSWNNPELANAEDWTDREDADRGATETAFRMSEQRRILERRTPFVKPKTAGPGELMIEPPRFRRSVATPGTEARTGGKERSGKREAGDFRANPNRNLAPSSVRPNIGKGVPTRPLSSHEPERIRIPHPTRASYPSNGSQCYNCSEWGHIAQFCPKKKDMEEPMEIGVTKGRVFWAAETKPTYTLPIRLNGQEKVALVDSGCSQSLIRQDLVGPRQAVSQTHVLIACVPSYYPVAMIRFQWRGEEETLRVGVLPHLEEDIIIGTDYTALPQLVSKAGEEHMMKRWWEEVPYDTEIAETRPIKPRLSKRQKRVQRQQHWEEKWGNTAPPGITGKVYTVAGDF